jgi:Cu-Zn family superoxide dismutase
MRHLFIVATCTACGIAFAADTQPSKDLASSPHGHAAAGANAALKPTQGHQVAGALSLAAERSGVRIGGSIQGLQPNSEQGFHIHEKGDCSAPDASSAGAHFNPTAQPHGNPKGTGPKHLGDMVNLRADAQGVAKVNVFIAGASLHTNQPTDLLGKAIVVHAKPDDYKSQPAGDSGDRVACGVIKNR